MDLVGAGSSLTAADIAGYVDQIPAGGNVRLQFDLRSSLGASVVNGIQDTVNAAGLNAMVSTGSPILNFDWVKEAVSAEGSIGQDPLTDIAIILAAIVVIAVLIIGWRVYESLSPIGKDITKYALVILVAGAAVLLLASAIGKIKGNSS